MTRDDFRRQTVSATQSRRSIWGRLLFAASIPLVVPLFLGDILAAPFVARRHESGFRWSLFMVARFLGPVIAIGAFVGYLIRRLR
jgi:hypothetical protein